MKNEDKPNDQEIEWIYSTKKIVDSLNKLQSSEDSVMKGFKDLSNKMKKSNTEFKSYVGLKQEEVRLFIQLVNRKSDMVSNQDLNKLREHVKQIENAIEVDTEILNSFIDISEAYKEYQKALKDFTKSGEKLNKNQKDWHDSSANLSKALSSQMTPGHKLDKLEKAIANNKITVSKGYEEYKHQERFVETGVLRLNQAWAKLKTVIKNIGW